MEHAYADRIGLALEYLSPEALDRLIVAACLNPSMSRREIVRFILTGEPRLPEDDMNNTYHATLMQRRLLCQCGLLHAALLGHHRATIDAILDDIPPAGATNNKPLSRIKDRAAMTRVRAHLTKLPRTPEITAILAETEDGPVSSWF